MLFHDSLKRLEASDVFTAWRAENPTQYLVHGFLMLDPRVKTEWQIGYYSKKSDRIVTFSIDEANVVTVNPPSEIFKENKLVLELDPKKVTSDAQTAVNLAKAHQQKNFPGQEASQIMILLQHLERGQIWNITFVTKSFSVCNFKIDAATNKVVHANCETLLGWGEAVPGELRKP